MYTYEIYLNNSYITKNEWLHLIESITNYVNIFNSWQIIIVNNNHKLQYFISINKKLPSTINTLDNFLFKKIANFNKPKNSLAFPIIHNPSNSFIDLINYNEIKNKGNLIFLNIKFIKLYKNKILSKITYFVENNKKVNKYHAFLNVPANILSIDFKGNKRYFYNSIPKYLDINKLIPLLSNNEFDSLLKVDTFPYLDNNLYLPTNSFSFDKHSLILGASGSGKSKFISKLVYNIINNNETKNKYRIVIIDPHSDLINDIGGLGKVIDFNNSSINLFANIDNEAIAQTELLLDLFKSLIKDQYNAKLERILRYSITTLLIDKSFNLVNLKELITNTEFRLQLINKLKYTLPTNITNFFISDFNDLKTKSYTEAISPIISFIDELSMLPALNEDFSTQTLKDVVKDNNLILFSLNKLKIGTKITKTISGLIMNQMLNLIQSRCIKEPIIFIIDEIATIENPIISKFLSEARKYNLSLILAGQYFNQLSDDIKNAIFANTSNYYIFRISKLDATTMVDNLNIKIPLDDTKERKIELLSNLNNRECIIRIAKYDKLLPPFKATTINYQSIPYVNKGNLTVKTTTDKNVPKIKFNISTKTKLQDLIIPNESE